MIEDFQSLTTAFSELAWGPWLLVLLLGGGLYFLLASHFTPFRYLGHAWALLRGKYSDPKDPGHISHFQALSAALSGTIGMGNIAGVALAIYVAGPGAIFWMWATAVLGIATKFFTCTLAVMYRGRDSEGELQGGPMYVIREGLGPRWRWMAMFFAVAGLVGCLPAFQTNQLVQVLRDVLFIDNGWLAVDTDPFLFNLATGGLLATLTAVVMFGGIVRIAHVASAVVPFMAVLYLSCTIVALTLNADAVPAAFALILTDAFTGEAAAGGALLTVMLYGVQRGAFSNEAGIGTEALAHGAARTDEPVREGLVAMTGPIIDTLIICTATALMILVSGVWQGSDANGVTLTAAAFSTLLGPTGTALLFVCVVCFSLTTILTYSFYGTQCANYVLGAQRKHYYRWAYLGFILVAAVISLEAAIGIIDGMFALMAIPTMVSTLLLSPKVVAAAKDYFNRLDRS